MKLFLDANILVSVLNKEYPVFTYSSRILSLAGYDHIDLFSTPNCLAIAWYFAEKKSGRKKANRKMEILISHLKITSAEEDVVHQTLQNKAVEDFEDGLQYYAALKAGCEYIITEVPEDFYFSRILVTRAEEFLIHHFNTFDWK